MKIIVSDIEKNTAPKELDYEEPKGAFEPDIELGGPAKVKCSLSFDGNTLSINGSVAAQIRLFCARCLEPYTQKASYRFSARYCGPRPHMGSNVELEAGELDEEVLPPGGIIDLSDLIRQHLLLSLPVKQLCSGSCKGLCAQCGANLNQGECGCSGDR